MSRRYCLLCAILVFSLQGCLAAADQWIKLATPHFELYTTAGERKGREAILYFEQVRSFFLEASESKHVSEFPVRIVAFRGETQYQPYHINEFAIAYYTHGKNRDYIVMQDIASEHYPVAIHEYTHLVIEHAGLNPPPWLNEGLAELYSTLTPVGKKAAVGDIIPGRSQMLLTNKWIPLDVLTSADRRSPLYNERNHAGMFYAESWALTHMLYFSPAYRPKFATFLAAASSGKTADEACWTVFGRRLADVEMELRQYLRRDRFYRAVYDIKLEKSAEDPDVSDASAFESGMVLADLLAITHRPKEALSAYQQLAASNPDKPDVEESLGYLAWQSGDSQAARIHFQKALAAGTKNAQMCYDYAMLSRYGSDAAKNASPAFQRALELKPDYPEARLQFGLMLVNTRDYPQAIAQLGQIKKVDAEQAQWLFAALAFAYFETGDKGNARANAELAKKWAKTPEQMERARAILEALDPKKMVAQTAAPGQEAVPRIRRAPARNEFQVVEPDPPAANPFVEKEDKMSRVEGTAQRLDCSGKTARFHVLVGKTAMIFEIPDPDRVLIKHSDEMKHEFACGAQGSYKVAVDYAVLPDAKRGVAGVVRGLEF